ncbi:MAG: SRPBCC family protein [Verrucomicrobiales bacterium]|nr:SRPBCC family protein [Verrucomicrobiales bacterium]MCP5559830.1 SRPBCC family protein [Verrucomicrobiaceae bacterium]
MPFPPPIDSPIAEREIVLVRETTVPRERLYAGWTQPDLLVQWFTPSPWVTTKCEIDLRVGGTCKTTMRSPEGEEFPNVGVYLDIVPNERLVFTDAYGPDWEPNPNPFFTAVLTFECLADGKTRYTARAMHWTKEACERHAAMGFIEGWGKAFDQLIELVGDK